LAELWPNLDHECMISSNDNSLRVPGFDIQSTQRADCNVEVHYDEMPLIGEADTTTGDVTVVVTFQNALLADGTVMAAGRLVMMTVPAPSPFQNGFERLLMPPAVAVAVIINNKFRTVNIPPYDCTNAPLRRRHWWRLLNRRSSGISAYNNVNFTILTFLAYS
jgi:hypothetical protein